ncbi:sodium/potassium/calcium exchanger 1-like [Senna tora]|uniref:Sodium/potassium/calcium exchanger 1-like n=1 Tax=Senna tora TaxID=362788 RepID=A0A834WJX3_9FABA|nr:sodium/potassium/calcium exchanger 1-like [Senna tora]
MWSFFELKDGLAEMGHKEKYDMWFANPNVRLEDTLRPIVDDRGAMEMGVVGLVVGMVDLYLLHTPFEFTEILTLLSNEPPPPPDTDDGDEDTDDGKDNDAVEEDNDGDDYKEDGDQSDDLDDDSDADSATDIRFNDSEEEDVEKDYFDSGDEAKEQRTKRRMDKAAVQPEPVSDEEYVTVPTCCSSKVRGLSDEEYNFEELRSETERSYDYEEEVIVRRKFPRWRESKDFKDYKFEIGTIFGTKEEFINAVKCFAVFNGRGVKFVKNDKKMVRAVGRDPNDQMLLIVFVVVEAENKDTWSWFLELIITDLGPEGRADLCVISDQQKVLF